MIHSNLLGKKTTSNLRQSAEKELRFFLQDVATTDQCSLMLTNTFVNSTQKAHDQSADQFPLKLGWMISLNKEVRDRNRGGYLPVWTSAPDTTSECPTFTLKTQESTENFLLHKPFRKTLARTLKHWMPGGGLITLYLNGCDYGPS